jgi:hypothetical protein
MLDWLFGGVIGWALGLVVVALVWPIYKSGFLVRQGLAYQKSLNKVDDMIRSSSAQLGGATLAPTGEYHALRRKALAFMVLPSLGLITLFVILLVFANWKMAALELGLAVIGFFNVD